MLRLLLLWLLPLLTACGESPLQLWHTLELESEFSIDDSKGIDNLQNYLQLEDKLFAELDQRIYSITESGPRHELERYSRDSRADPGKQKPNWNRSFELQPDKPIGGVLLLHGMSDSPYSLRSIGETLHDRGYHVLGLRMPGHGTIPSGLLRVSWQDMARVVRLGMTHLQQALNDEPIHIIGYSTGAALALDFALQAEQGEVQPEPASLVLISPAIGLSPGAALAQWGRRLSVLPGLGRLAWLDIMPEFDPYKYNSFTTNAAEQVHRLTSSVAQRIAARAKTDPELPPVLVIKSTVDATVSNNAVVDRLLLQLAPQRHQMVLFDINRFATHASILVDDPGPFTRRLLEDKQLPFGVTLLSNARPDSSAVNAWYKPPNAAGPTDIEALTIDWPTGILSLSHVALPFPPDDPIYGAQRPVRTDTVFLGAQALQGERGMLKIPGDFLLRLRYNPFYSYMQKRILQWLKDPASR